MNSSMHRGAVAPVAGPGHPVALGKKRVEDGQDCLLAGFNKGAAGDLLSVPQDVFGFGQFVHAAMLRGTTCMCMHIFLKKVERK